MSHTSVIGTVIQGECDPRFTAVRQALARNFAERGEIGSAVAIYYRGEKVADLWGGHMDAARTRPWRADTLCLMYSIAKSMCALCVHILADRGQVDLEAPVAAYWPEFAQNGKDAIRVRHILSHNCGVCFADAAAPGDIFGVQFAAPFGDEAAVFRLGARFEAEAPLGSPPGADSRARLVEIFTGGRLHVGGIAPRHMGSAQGKVLDPAREIGGIRGGGDQLEIVNTLADRHVKLMSVHEAGKRATGPLPLGCLRKQVCVPREQDPPERGSPVQKLWVGEAAGAILLSRQDLDAAEPKAFRYGTRDVNVHVEANAQESRPRALSRATRGEFPASRRSRRTVCSCRAISASSAAWWS